MKTETQFAIKNITQSLTRSFDYYTRVTPIGEIEPALKKFDQCITESMLSSLTDDTTLASVSEERETTGRQDDHQPPLKLGGLDAQIELP
jgi:hypothetical protein